MKKHVLICLLSAALLVLTACGGGQAAPQQGAQPPAAPPEGPSPEAESPEEVPGEAPEQAPEETPAGSGALVVYFSATGSTRAVAETIADALSADIFEIIPAEPYTSDDLDWTDSDSRVSREHDDPALRTMELAEPSVEGWEDYDTVFLGYPIWWGIAAWPVDNFVSANDFTGKTVIPFCTSSSSGLGDSGELLRDLAGSGDWLEGQRFRSGAEESDIVDWVESLPISE